MVVVATANCYSNNILSKNQIAGALASNNSSKQKQPQAEVEKVRNAIGLQWTYFEQERESE